jgi:para-nitrobenzyl esterase
MRVERFSALAGHAVQVLAAAAALMLGSITALAGMTAPVTTRSGLVSGVPSRWHPSVTVFEGIPYAAPPVGRLRWRSPQPPVPWRGVRKADRFGATCPQPGATPAMRASMSEDCLFLNVWTAATSPKERRPVFVWIYGGGFTVGTGSDPLFDGAGLARKGLVVVTFNYRLGALGFLATPALSKESGHDASGDYGMLDQIAVLEWVHDNIAAFGGDPRRVTIAGQSAGAGSVGFLDMSPLAKGLFQRAIGESHARYPRDPELRYLSTSYRTLENAEKEGVKYAAAHGARTLQQLRAMPWQRLIKDSNTYDASVQTGSDARPPLFRPVIDGWVIPKGYSRTYEAGLQTSVPYIAGNNHDETGAVPETAFAGLRAQTGARKPGPGSPYPNVTLGQFDQAAQMKFGPLAAEYLQLYPASTDQQAALENNAEVHDNSRISTFLWASTWTKHARGPVFTYFWTHAPPGASHDTRGAYHGSEINYVFDNLYATDRPWTSTDRRIADIMSSYWVNFAKDGNPNGKGLPFWPAFDPKKQQVMELGDHFGPMSIASSQARFDFWRHFFATQTAW